VIHDHRDEGSACDARLIAAVAVFIDPNSLWPGVLIVLAALELELFVKGSVNEV
jgi:hypothetical protein